MPKASLDGVLGSLGWQEGSCPWQGVEQDGLQGSFQPKPSYDSRKVNIIIIPLYWKIHATPLKGDTTDQYHEQQSCYLL